MNNINSDVFQTARDSVTPSVIENLFSGGEWKKGEYWLKNPLRHDTKPNSFSISETGLYHDFSSGHSGDIIDLIEKAFSVSKLEAAHMIIEKSGGIIPDVKPTAKKKKDKPTAVVPVPEAAKSELEKKVREKYFVDTYGEPVKIYQYKDYDNRLIMSYVL
jgi:hypothetical protein